MPINKKKLMQILLMTTIMYSPFVVPRPPSKEQPLEEQALEEQELEEQALEEQAFEGPPLEEQPFIANPGAKYLAELRAKEEQKPVEKPKSPLEQIKIFLTNLNLNPSKKQELQDKYQYSIVNTKKIKPEDFERLESQTLLAIVPWEDKEKLLWDKNKERVLLSSWVPNLVINDLRNGMYVKFRSGIKKVTTPDEMGKIWVSSTEEIMNFINTIKNQTNNPDDLPLRLRYNQKIGLPINFYKTAADIGNFDWDYDRSLVSFWVNPKDLERPCINSQIVDHTCIIDVDDPEHQEYLEKMLNDSHNNPHVKWFETKKHMAYTGTNPMPWTREGYTYDWAYDELPKSYGFTEFIVKPKAEITIAGIADLEDIQQALRQYEDENKAEVVIMPERAMLSPAMP